MKLLISTFMLALLAVLFCCSTIVYVFGEKHKEDNNDEHES